MSKYRKQENETQNWCFQWWLCDFWSFLREAVKGHRGIIWSCINKRAPYFSSNHLNQIVKCRKDGSDLTTHHCNRMKGRQALRRIVFLPQMLTLVSWSNARWQGPGQACLGNSNCNAYGCLLTFWGHRLARMDKRDGRNIITAWNSATLNLSHSKINMSQNIYLQTRHS